MDNERRRDLRHPVQLAAVVGPARLEVDVANVSFRGLLVRVDAPMVLGRLYRAALLVGHDERIPLHLVPTRHVHGPAGALIGAGVRLLGQDARWDRFVGDLLASSVRRFTPPPSARPVASTREVDRLALAK